MYRPPKCIKDFNLDVADLLGNLMLGYDRVLIVVELNIHVRCETRPLVKDFLSLMDTLILLSGCDPTHEMPHTCSGAVKQSGCLYYRNQGLWDIRSFPSDV